jgi:hypothetical protein
VPELDFFATNGDEERIVEEALRLGGQFVPDVGWPTKSYESFVTLDEFRAWREKTTLFFILAPVFQHSPLVLHEVPSKGTYRILQKNGGPSVDLFLPNAACRDGRLLLRAAVIGHHAKYWDPVRQEMVAAPASLRTFYRALVSTIKRGGEKVVLGSVRRRYRVCRDARRAVETGSAALGP